jgi:hypothetical protein
MAALGKITTSRDAFGFKADAHLLCLNIFHCFLASAMKTNLRDGEVIITYSTIETVNGAKHASVPEPTTMFLFGSGLIALAG